MTDNLIEDGGIKPLLTVWAVTPGARDLFGSIATLEEVERQLAALSRRRVTSLIARVLFTLSEDPAQAEIAELLRLRRWLLPPDVRLNVSTLQQAHGADHVILFARPQLLTALRLAQACCVGEEAGLSDEALRHAVGLLIPQITDLMNGPLNLLDGDEAGSAAVMMSVTADANIPEKGQAQIRALRLVTLVDWSGFPVLSSARERLSKTLGLSLQDVVAFLMIMGDLLATSRLSGSAPVIHPVKLFANAKSGSGFRRVLQAMALDFDELPSKVGQTSRIVGDRKQEPFRSQPLIGFPDDHWICSDYLYFSLGPSAGLVWLLKRLSSGAEDVLREWGLLIEAWLSAELINASPEAFRPHPMDGDDEITDGLLDYGNDVVLVEFKTSSIPDEVKFGRSGSELVRSIKSKILKNAQIGRAVERLFGKRRLGSRFLTSLGPAGTDSRVTIWPLLICSDASLSASAEVERLVASTSADESRELGTPADVELRRATVVSLQDAQWLFELMKDGFLASELCRERSEVDPGTRETFHNFLAAKFNAGKCDRPFRETHFQELKMFVDSFWEGQGDPKELSFW